ncbi:MAG TPA: CdaR family protein, partial [Candidatus Eremiobacteraceae bacterium]|nr:CdaR family protein [Candidatus Eremiobacteraceae bacterium]
FILWFTFNYLTAGEAKYSKTLVVPVTVQHVPGGFVASTAIRQVTVELSGARSKLDGLSPDDFTAFVDASGKGQGTYALEVSMRGGGMDSIKSITPASATVVLDRYGYRRVPVVLQEVGTPDGGRAQVVPTTVVVAGAQTAVAQVMAAQATLSYPAGKGAVLMELHPLPVDAQLRPVAGVTVDPPLVRATIAVPKVTKAQ